MRRMLATALSALLLTVVTASPGAAVTTTTVLAGLARPDELAAAPNGDLYFIQSASDAEVVLDRLAPGAASPVAVLDVPDYRSSVLAEPPIQSIGFDGRGDVYWIQRTLTDPRGSRGRSAVVRLDPRTGTTTELWGADATPMPTSYNGGPLTSGATVDVLAIARSGTLYFAGTRFDPVRGAGEGVVYSLRRDASAPTVLARFPAVANENTVDVSGITVDERDDVYVLVNGPGIAQVWDVTLAGEPRLVTEIARHPQPGTTQNYLQLGTTPRGDLFVTQNVRHGVTAWGCAASTDTNVWKFRRGSRTGTLVSQQRRAGFYASFVPSQAYFRVSRSGELVGQIERVTRAICPPVRRDPPYTSEIAVYGVARSPHGALAPQVLLSDDTLTPSEQWGEPATYAFGPDGSVYIASKHLGTIVRTRL